MTQPLHSQVLESNIPHQFRDTEGHWFGLTSRSRILYVSKERVEPGAITYPWCRDLVDRYVDVGEDEIARGMRDALARQHLLVEGAVGVAIAGCRADRARKGARVAVVVCGGNLPYDLLQRLTAG